MKIESQTDSSSMAQVDFDYIPKDYSSETCGSNSSDYSPSEKVIDIDSVFFQKKYFTLADFISCMTLLSVVIVQESLLVKSMGILFIFLIIVFNRR